MSNTKIDHYLLIILKAIMILGVATGFILSIKIAFTYFLPIVLATLFSMFLEPMVRTLEKVRINRIIGTLLSMLLFIGLLVFSLILGISRAVTELSVFYNRIPEYSTQFYESITNIIETGKNLYVQLPPDALAIVQQSVGALFEKVTSLMSAITTGVISTLTSLPGILIFSLITLIATFFITKDKVMIKAFLLRQFSPSTQEKIINLKDSLFVAVIGFFKAQFTFITITFFESFIGLSLIGVEYVFILALIIAFVDILPVLGTGSIYVPWAIFSFINGNYVMGFSLLILWTFIFIVRYIIEPKVYGHQLGIHPLVALISLFAGLKLIGVAGLILGPAVVVVFIACQKAGLFPSFK